MAKHKKRKLHSHGVSIKQNKISKDEPQKTQESKQTSGPTIPFEPEDRILLVGEGDFSFAKSIVEHHGCYDVTASCLDSKDELFEKYKPQAEEHVQYLEDKGQTILYNIDATKLDSIKALRKTNLFRKMVFNFPHVGGKSKDVNRQVRFNQELLVKFFASAIPLLEPSGTIIVTLFEGEPYTLWNIRDLARHTGLEVQRSFKFQPSAYLGYSHARTLGNIDGGGGWKGENRESRSYVFRKKATSGSPKRSGGVNKRKRRGSDESSDDE
jgi:25S rRNA (uracil2634-N3)-methyltransferase